MNNVDDLKIASIKIDEVNELIREQEKKTNYSQYLVQAASWLSVTGSIVFFMLCTCCCCCCSKTCRNIMFWLWDRWTPRNCLRETRERLCINLFQPLPGSTINVNSQGTLVRASSGHSLHDNVERTYGLPERVEEQETSFFTPDTKENRDEAIFTRTRLKSKILRAQLR